MPRQVARESKCVETETETVSVSCNSVHFYDFAATGGLPMIVVTHEWVGHKVN